MSGLSKVIEVVAIIAIAIGGLLVFAIGGFVLLVGIGQRLTRNRLVKTTVYRHGRSLPRLAFASGRTSPVPGADLVTAPVSGVRCVWYRVRVWREYYSEDSLRDDVIWECVSGDQIGLDDGTGFIGVSTKLLEHNLLGSDDPKLIEGSAGIDGLDFETALARVQAREPVPPAILRYIDKGHKVWIDESVVRSDRRFVALGTPRRLAPHSVMFVRALYGRSGVSLLPVEEIRRRSIAEDAEDWSMVRSMGGFGLVTLAIGYALHMLAAYISPS